jgi:hypothetical protein
VKAVGDRTIVFVDSASAAWRAATVCPGACLVSDNPLLAHDARVGVVIDDISRHLDQAEATRLGYAAVDTLLAIDGAWSRRARVSAMADHRVDSMSPCRSALCWAP